MSPLDIKALDYIRGCITRGGFSPTLIDVARHLGLSGRPSAHRLVNRLVASGHLARATGKKRGLSLPEMPDLRAIDTAALRAELERRAEEPGMLARPERRAMSHADTACAVDTCSIAVRPGHAFCLTHWRQISPDAQQALLETHRIANRTGHHADLRAFQDAFGRALAEAEGAPWDREAA